MADPITNTTVVFEDISAGLMTQYHGGVQAQFERLGHQTNRWFKPTKKRLEGKDLEVTVEHRIQQGARVTDDVLAAMPTPRNYSLDTYTVSIDQTAADNDLHRIAAAIRVTHIDILRAENNAHEKARLVQKLRKEALEDVDETMAISRWLTENGVLGTLDGAAKQNDNFYYDSASATGGAVASVRVKIDTPIGRFHDGMVVDVSASSTATAPVTNGDALTVLDVNVADNSLGLTDASSDKSAIVDNTVISRSGELGNGIISMGAWFAGETTLFGKNRADATLGHRWMIPTRTRVGATSTTFSLTMLNDLAVAMGYTQRDVTRGYVLKACPEIVNDVLEAVDDKTVVNMAATDSANPFATYGFNGFVYHHPALGKIALQADPLCDRNIIRMIRPSDWETIWGTSNKFQWIPGQLGGIWYRLPSTDPNTGNSLSFQADGYLTMCDICLHPRYQGEITNLTT